MKVHTHSSSWYRRCLHSDSTNPPTSLALSMSWKTSSNTFSILAFPALTCFCVSSCWACFCQLERPRCHCDVHRFNCHALYLWQPAQTPWTQTTTHWWCCWFYWHCSADAERQVSANAGHLLELPLLWSPTNHLLAWRWWNGWSLRWGTGEYQEVCHHCQHNWICIQV